MRFSPSLHSDCSWMRSNAFLGFFGLFPTSSTLPDAPDASALSPGSPRSSQPPLGEFSPSFRSTCPWTCSNAFLGFFGHFLASSSPPGTPATSTSPVVGLASQLTTPFLSPSSSMLGGSSCDLTVSSGLVSGGGGFGGALGMSSYRDR